VIETVKFLSLLLPGSYNTSVFSIKINAYRYSYSQPNLVGSMRIVAKYPVIAGNINIIAGYGLVTV
jgi:hypothetical protein